MSEWISVKGKLKPAGRVIVSLRNGNVLVAKYDKKDRCWYSDSYCEVSGVTHWMPLPAPPKD